MALKKQKISKMKYDLTLVLGLKGSGKTTYLARAAIKAHKGGHTIYSNVDLPYSIKFDIKTLCDPFVPLPGSLVIIDEAGIEMDNRDFKNFKKGQLCYLKLQRHLKNKVILASQDLDIDKKARKLLDQIIYVKRFCHFFVFSRPLVNYLHVDDDPKGESNDCNICVAWKWTFFTDIRFIFLPLWWNKFDSFSLEQLPDKAKDYIFNGYKIEISPNGEVSQEPKIKKI